MLAIERCGVSRSYEFPVVSGAMLRDEGAALVADYTNGRLEVKPSNGDAGEIFVGISLSTIQSLDVVPEVVEIDVDASALKVVLSGTPIPGTVRVTKEDGTVVASASAPAAGKYVLTGNVMEFHADDAGKTFTARFEKRPTLAEARNLQGDVAPGVAVTTELGSTGVIQGGTVFTSLWDTSCEWKGTSTVRLGANGKLTTAGTGTEVRCLIVELPRVGSPFIGISFNV